ncbi:hypothetical protein [Vibrio caribbeanicus]|uniref:hypothetical protein n=1 Tax=Vibrio caribbeanicus TaxID=701175 RepID=UPI00228525C0|nr:hypothetical protein [Vibrio caribbeanicus]MCY9844881.1 hypothetical protein [Vibrio caribbeanicus]
MFEFGDSAIFFADVKDNDLGGLRTIINAIVILVNHFDEVVVFGTCLKLQHFLPVFTVNQTSIWL